MLSVLDGIVLIEGLANVGIGEILIFENKEKEQKVYILGMAMNIYPTIIGVVLLGNDYLVKNGSKVWRTFDSLLIKVGIDSFGKYLNALGEWVSLDKKTGKKENTFRRNRIVAADLIKVLKNNTEIYSSEIVGQTLYNFVNLKEKRNTKKKWEYKNRIEVRAPSIIDRTSIREPLHTGILAIDALIPIGRGQRELIIGDRQTGKTAIIIDMFLNQKKANWKGATWFFGLPFVNRNEELTLNQAKRSTVGNNIHPGYDLFDPILAKQIVSNNSFAKKNERKIINKFCNRKENFWKSF